MRVLRLILACLVLVLVLAGFGALALSSPYLQTVYVNRVLSRHPDWHASVETASIGWSRVTLSNLRVERNGAVLTLPKLDATLPVWTAYWEKKLLVSRVVAKGWTFEPAPAGHSDKSASSVTPQSASAATQRKADAESPPLDEPDRAAALKTLSRWLAEARLPANCSIAAIESEGDMRLVLVPERGPIDVHVRVDGGGVRPDTTAKLAVAASTSLATESLTPVQLALRGNLAIALSHVVDRVELSGAISSDAATFPRDLTVAARLATHDASAGQRVDLDLRRAGRSLVVLSCTLGKSHRLEGTWKLNLDASDTTGVLPRIDLPGLVLAGEGRIAADTTLSVVTLSGRASGTVDRLRGFSAAGKITADAEFDVTQRGAIVNVDRCVLSVAGTHPLLSLQAAQPFTYDLSKRQLTVRDAAADWLRIDVREFPAEWLSPLPHGIGLRGGSTTGQFNVKSTGSTIVAQSAGAIAVKNLTLDHAGRTLVSEVDATATLAGRYDDAKGWSFELTPLRLTSAGHELATFRGTVTPLREPYRFAAVAGNLQVDLEACASQPMIAERRWIRGRSLAADFRTNIGPGGDFVGKVSVVGHAADRTLVADVSASIEDYSAVMFRMPLTIGTGAAKTEIATSGTWAVKPGAQQIDVAIDGATANLEQLKLIASAAGLDVGDGPRPFWGDLTGRARFDFRELTFGTKSLENVGGTFDLEPHAFRLHGGRAIFNPQQPTKLARGQVIETPSEPRSALSAEIEVAFDPKAELPYALSGTGSVDEIDVTRLLGATRIGGSPLLEGHVAAAVKTSGKGATLPDLIAHRHDEFRLTSKAGILRILKTDVAAEIPDAPTPVSDALATVGSAFGAIFGRRGNSIASEVHLPKPTEAVLNATYETKEFAFTDFAVTAMRALDGGFQLSDIVVAGANERLTGSGALSHAPDRPLNAWPLRLELDLGVKGTLADKLKVGGVPLGQKDELGYERVKDRLTFAGTLGDLDNSAWRALLVKAATAPLKQAKPSR